MTTFLFFSHPTRGHLAPASAVVAELVRRGARVVACVSENGRASLESTGAELRVYAAPHGEFDPVPATEGLFADMARLARLSATLLPGLTAIVNEERPDCVLLDSKSLPGRLAAQICGVRAVTMSVVFAINGEVIGAADIVDHLYAGAPRDVLLNGLRDLERYADAASSMDARFGTRSPGIIDFLGNPQQLNVIFTSRELQPHAELFDERYRFVGPCLNGREEAEAFDLDHLGRPLVYISLGTTFQHAPAFYDAAFAACAGAPWHALVSTGGAELAATPPPNVEVRAFVPQLAVLRRAAAAVTHGGMNSVNEALYHGVPLVVVPQRGDQHFVARRVEELGAGIHVPPAAATAERLRDAVARVTGEPRFRSSAARLGASMRAAGGARSAGDAILTFAGAAA